MVLLFVFIELFSEPINLAARDRDHLLTVAVEEDVVVRHARRRGVVIIDAAAGDEQAGAHHHHLADAAGDTVTVGADVKRSARDKLRSDE